MLQSVLTIKGQLQHDTNSYDNWRSITACYDQVWQLKVNYNMLWSVLTIKCQLQHIDISNDYQRSITMRCDQFL
jgi:hypothetical protein